MEITSVKKSTSKIKRISPAGKSTSYDFTVKDTHRILANGFYTSNCAHPEIETFINIKRDLKKVTGANISIRLTDDFMQAVKDNAEFNLQWPVDVPLEEASIVKKVSAKVIWDQIIDAAWTSAEPGLLFWDTVKRNTPTEAYKSLGYGNVSTNPCVAGDTIVVTNAGSKTVKELSDAKAQFIVKSYNIETGKIETNSATAFKTKENAKLLQITTKSGKKIKLTPDHRVYTQRGWVEAGELSLDDKILSVALETTEWDEIAEITNINNEDVYDLSVDNVHNFFANDLLVHNCGELVLSPYDSCRLLLVNLSKFVKDSYETGATFDYVKFATATQVAQRLMDDLVDLELEAVDKIISKIENDKEPPHVKLAELSLWQKIKSAASGARRTGLGITALGDALAQLGIKYGSEDSVTKTEEIYKVLAVNAYRSTVKMATERGTFPVYSYDLEKDHPFLQRIMSVDPTLKADYLKYGRRNIALTTTAPAGSVSCLTQTTSGIEPAFLVSYTRRKKLTATDVDSRVDFVDALGDKWQEYKIYHHGYKTWMDVVGKGDNVELSPYWKATSNDIDWGMSVKLQAAAQKWVCHSLSKTCNLPSDATRETVAQVYMSAWESGCKGFTVYRDGCRSGVLVADEPKKESAKSTADDQPTTIVENHAPKRPKELPCDIHRINVRGSEGTENYLVLVGKLQGTPYEVFCGLSSHVEVPKKAKSGRLVRLGKKDGLSVYNLHIPVATDDEIIFKNVVDLFDNPTYGSFTRSLSLSMRHGIPTHYIVEQLQKDKHSDMQSFSRVISRVLKGYIPNGTKSASDKVCHSCGAESLVYTEGCVTCVSCSWSKC